jgi:glycosyltransferase 2 family protein
MRSFALRALAGLALFALVLHFADPLRVLKALGTPDPLWLLAGFAAAVAASISSALRWHALAAWLGMDATRHSLIFAYWRGITANTVLPGGHLGGDALRALHLQTAGHGLGNAAASVALDRLSGLWMLAVISLGTMALALSLNLLQGALPGVSAPLIILAALLTLLAPLLAWRISDATQQHLSHKLAALLGTLHQRTHPLARYFSQMLWSSVVQLLSITAFACGGHAIGLHLSWWVYFIACGPIFLLAALPVSVGGWGTREAAAVMTLGAFGASRDLAIAAAILYGLFAALQGLLGALTLLQAKDTD